MDRKLTFNGKIMWPIFQFGITVKQKLIFGCVFFVKYYIFIWLNSCCDFAIYGQNGIISKIPQKFKNCSSLNKNFKKCN